MNSILFVTIAFLFFILVIAFFISLVVWGTTPIGKEGCGADCDTTLDCSDGLVCDNGTCAIGYYGNCNGNENHCLTGSSCVNGSCIPNTEQLVI